MRDQFSRLLGVGWLLSSGLLTSKAEESTEDPTLIWKTPNGSLRDFDSQLEYRVGDAITLEWDAWPYENVINSTAVNVDLWLAGAETTFNSRISG
jgi:hypothetical protein